MCVVSGRLFNAVFCGNQKFVDHRLYVVMVLVMHFVATVSSDILLAVLRLCLVNECIHEPFPQQLTLCYTLKLF